MTVPHAAINEALSLLPPEMGGPKARVMLIAIGLQESRFEHRRQIGGPARGFWQFEHGGGVVGVLTHPASRELAARLCEVRGVKSDSRLVYNRLEHDDVLAAGFARLLLFTDRRRLPELGDAVAAWKYYMHNWRPGKPHPETWDELYHAAVAEVEEG